MNLFARTRHWHILDCCADRALPRACALRDLLPPSLPLARAQQNIRPRVVFLCLCGRR